MTWHNFYFLQCILKPTALSALFAPTLEIMPLSQNAPHLPLNEENCSEHTQSLVLNVQYYMLRRVLYIYNIYYI